MAAPITSYYFIDASPNPTYLEAEWTQNAATPSIFVLQTVFALPIKPTVDAAAISPYPGNGGPPQTLPSPTPDAGTSGLGPGAVAGVAIGCIIAGLTVGFLIALLILRHKGQQKHASQAPLAMADTRHRRSPSSSAMPRDRLQLSQFLLDATPDREISAELSSLNELISEHVDSHYHSHTIEADTAALSRALVELGFASTGSLDVDTLVALCVKPRTRQAALRHVVSYLCFSMVDFTTRSRLSMLPMPVAAFLQSVPPVERHGGTPEAVTAALSKWRTLSAFLLHAQRTERTPLVPAEATIQPQAAGVAAAMNTFLGPFARPSQERHLGLVVEEVAKLGYVLFSHPADWRFVHAGPARDRAGGGRVLVVCAGLERTSSGKDGRVYDVPRQVAQAVLVAV